MFYYYLRFFNYIFTVFGIRKPFLSYFKTPSKMLVWHHIWSFTVLVSMIMVHIFTIKSYFTFNLKNNLNIFYETNEIIINVLVLIINSVYQRHLVDLYEGIDKILHDCRISEMNLKIISIKLYFVFATPTIILGSFIILEILWANSFIIMITLPIFLSTFHLVLHLILLLAILKFITLKVIDLITFDIRIQTNNFIEELPTKLTKIKYMISPNVRFFQIDGKEHFDLKFMCRIYDELCSCIRLLEQHHGIQILFTFWLMFTNAVFGITMIACNNAEYPVLLVARSILPFIWCFIGSFINEQIDKQVELIDMTIIKCLIDFKCDQTRKIILQTFKQLIGSNRLQFTACSLFHLNYSMILGTIVNVITYSIIMIQLFLSDK